MTERTDVIVVGGGVIGLASALELLEAGRSVRLVERSHLGAGASDGNCGLITPSHALPLTQPGTVRQVLKGMWRASSPVLVRPRLDLGLLAWGLRFARRCNERSMMEAMNGRRALLDLSRALFPELVEREGLAVEWETLGLMEVFASEQARAAAEPVQRLLADHGIRSEPFEHDALLAREPALRDDVAGGSWYPEDAQLRPEALVRELARVVEAKGAIIEVATPVHGIETGNGRARGITTANGTIEADHLVLATGAWSPELGRQLGLRLPVQPGKGYSITMTRPEPCPTVPLLLSDANMGVTPWPSGYRLAGTMEFAGFDAALRRARLDALVKGARRFLREPLGEQGVEWCSWRPMCADELPIIDRAPRFPNVVVATGHGMMGVSMAPATAKLVAQLVTGAEPCVDPAPYALARFG